MAKNLNPIDDLKFKNNAKAGNKTSQPTKILTIGGNSIADEDNKRPLDGVHQHLGGKKDHIREKLDAMGLAILSCDWIQFGTLHHKLTLLKPKHGEINNFFREQIADAVVRNIGVYDFDELKRKLIEIGARDKVIDQGYQEGTERLLKLQNKKQHRA
jgi:hypothetical protein